MSTGIQRTRVQPRRDDGEPKRTVIGEAMDDLDRYDWAFVLLEWLVGMAAIKLGVDVHVVLLVLPLGVAFPVFRHLDITPARIRRLEAERATPEAKLDDSHAATQNSRTPFEVSDENAARLRRVAKQRGQPADEVLADLLREAEQHAA